MTNHSEAAGTSDNGDISGDVSSDVNGGIGGQQGSGGREGRDLSPHMGPEQGSEQPRSPAGKQGATAMSHEQPSPHAGHEDSSIAPGHDEARVYAGHRPATGPCGEHQVTLRTPAELADALPYLLGYRPEDSIVLVALHDRDGRGRFGGRARLGIPAEADDWPAVAEQLAHGLVTGSERRGARPESMVAFLCQDPSGGESAREVMERLRPLSQLLRRACGRLDVPVVEALCISGGRFWSYCCPGNGCCSSEGEAMGLPGTSVLAAAATYAGLQVRGTLRELRARLIPWETAAALRQEAALDAANGTVVPRILDEEGRVAMAEETLELAHRLMSRLAAAPHVSGTLQADLRDDELLGHEEVATLVLGLQDRSTRDRAAEWMEGDEAGPALRLWRALARRCVGAYGEHAAAPLTLAGWVAWSSGDELEAREALAMALAADRDYLFARLLHQACNEGLDPESIRRCLRTERRNRAEAMRAPADDFPERKSQSSAQERAQHAACAPGASGTGPRRRRRARSEGSSGVRAARRSSWALGDRRPRSADGTSPAGDGPGRETDDTRGRTRARRGTGGCGKAAKT
ncbi:DUF4192 domain-containing protein [Streptomyces bluensis]|uniref:DUF4192 domain-containing protein n=1 Tax=Streptomyces bluensis TaxID=33897 RepID=UPI00199867E2|nr:DUF4192 domain-containing protein [Streptomyces bluensis]GGZ82866.1 hypothetical protein GCM10010344_57520 [Streptomyces bluensis]